MCHHFETQIIKEKSEDRNKFRFVRKLIKKGTEEGMSANTKLRQQTFFNSFSNYWAVGIFTINFSFQNIMNNEYEDF